MKIHQTLHGYKDGHRLLAASVPLDPADERRLDALSDLSGYLDKSAEFKHYHTGYPLGPWWVCARTWLDTDAERRGTVLTHSLLIPRAEVGDIDDLTRFDPLFRKPARPFDLAAFRSSLDLPARGVATPLALDPASRRDLALSWFGQDRRPILWEDPPSAEPAARQLWAWMPPWLRPAWSFCTVALQPRYLDDRPLDWMGVAVPSSTVFYKLRDVACPVAGRARLEIPEPAWLPLLLEAPPAEIAALWALVRDGGFGEVRLTQLRLALQHQALRRRDDLSARLASLDILEGFGVEGGALAEQDVARALAALPAQPNGLIAVHDLVVRAPHTRAPSLSDDVHQALYAAARATTWTAPEVKRLPSLLASARQAGLAGPIERGLLERVASASDASAALPQLAALATADTELALRALLAMRGDLRAALMPDVVANPTLRPLALANALQSPYALADDLRSNPVLVSLLVPELLARPPVWTRADFDEVLGTVEPYALLDAIGLAQAAPPASLSQAIARRLARDVDLLDRRTPDWLRDPLFEAQGDRAPERLLAHPVEVLGWWMTRDMRVQPPIVGQLLDRAEPAALWALAAPDRLPPGRLGERWAARVLPAVLDAALRDQVALPEFVAWLVAAGEEIDRRPIRERLAEATEAELPRAVAIVALRDARSLRDRGTLERCLGSWREFPEAARWAARDEWLSLLSALRREDREAHAAFAVVLFAMAVNEPRADGGPLAEATFATVHDSLRTQSSYSWFNPLKWIEAWWGSDWDRAKHVRKAVAVAWVQGGWPPDTLLRLADGDADLLDDLVGRAVKEPHGAMAVARLKRQDLPTWARKVDLLR